LHDAQAQTERRIEARPVLLAVAGCSGSGKTTLAAQLARTLGGAHFQFDNYYRDLSHLPVAERGLQDFDDPELIESPLLIAHIRELAQGNSVDRPLYDFATHARIAGKTEAFAPAPYLLIEGLFALHYAALLPLYQLRIYVETPEAVCFARRLKRDIEERGRTAESVERQYRATVLPASAAFVRPSAVHADLTVDGAGALDWKVEQVLAAMRSRSLWPAAV
jgi:uridine kinase